MKKSKIISAVLMVFTVTVLTGPAMAKTVAERLTVALDAGLNSKDFDDQTRRINLIERLNKGKSGMINYTAYCIEGQLHVSIGSPSDPGNYIITAKELAKADVQCSFPSGSRYWLDSRLDGGSNTYLIDLEVLRRAGMPIPDGIPIETLQEAVVPFLLFDTKLVTAAKPLLLRAKSIRMQRSLGKGRKAIKSLLPISSLGIRKYGPSERCIDCF